MWTVQEIALNFKGVLNCGGVTLPWMNLVVAVDTLNIIKYKFGGWNSIVALQKYLTMQLLIENHPKGREIVNENNVRDDTTGIDNDFDVFRMFHYAREKKSFDPKDKIFALYAVLSEFGVKMPAPDYRKTLKDVYAESTLALIEHDQSLIVLHFVASPNRSKELPSWVPDFVDPIFQQQDPRFPLTRDRFGAGGPLEAEWESRLGGLQLLVRGKIIDRVMYRGQGLPFINAQELKVEEFLQLDHRGQLVASENLRTLQKSNQIFKEWCDMSQWSDTYPNGQTIKDALRTTILNDFPRCMNDYKCNAAFEPWLQYMSKPDEDAGPTNARPDASAQIALEFRRFTAFYTGPALPFHSLAMPFSSNKTFYRTEKGWFGTAPDFIPDSVQAGDVVATIRGMEMPVVLRPSDTIGGYQLISHCYMHGFMYGEAWDDGSEYGETGILLV